MKQNESKLMQLPKRTTKVSQLSIRTGLRGGDCLDTCNSVLSDWRKQYYELYEQSKYKTV